MARFSLQTIVLLFVVSFLRQASAEYRAFELEIVNTETGDSRRVIATVDHLQYPYLHPVKLIERVDYVTSWMCLGRTDARPICPNTNDNTQP